MKRYVILVSIILAFVFNGCSGSKSKLIKPSFSTNMLKSKIIVAKTEGKDTYFFKNSEVSSKSHTDINKIKHDLSEIFYFISKFGESNGYKYFVILNSKANNLNGFPINSFSNLIGLCEYEYYNAKRNYKPRQICWGDNDDSLINYRIRLDIKFFKNKIPGVFLYNIDEVITQTKQYIEERVN